MLGNLQDAKKVRPKGKISSKPSHNYIKALELYPALRYHRVACLKLRDIPVVSRCSFPAAQIAVGNAVTQQTVGLTALPPNVLISPCFPWTRRQTARVNLLTPRAASQRNRPVPRKRGKNMHRLSPEICIKER